jgi:hypothetical protein
MNRRSLRNAVCLGVLSVAPIVISAAMQSQIGLTLDTLTVPADRLPAGCVLPSASTVLDGSRMRGGLWVGLPITSNPWQGDDRRIVAHIRARVVASPRVPDTPLLTRAELARWHLQLADDVEEAYAATYADTGTRFSTVYGLRFKTADRPTPPRGWRQSPQALWLHRDRTVIAMSSSGGECSEAVRSYLDELTAR